MSKPQIIEDIGEVSELQTESKRVVAAVNENTEQIKNLSLRVEETFQSVSSGKTIVASAITDQGVSTEATATFQTMADNVRKITRGTFLIVNATFNGEPIANKEVVATSSDGDVIKMITDASGRAETELDPGDYTVTLGTETKTIAVIESEINVLVFNIVAKIYGWKCRLDATDPNAGEYTDDAIGMTPSNNTISDSWANTELYKSIKPCQMDKDGNVLWYLQKDNMTLKENGELYDQNSEYNFIEIPKLYWKMWQDSTYQYIQLSDNKIDSEFMCLAHTVGSREVDKIYVGAYLSGNVTGRLISRIGVLPARSQTIGTFRSWAKSMGSGFQQLDFYTLTLIQILYLIFYKNRDSQTQLGKGYTFTSGYSGTGNTKTKPFCHGYTDTNDGLQQMKFLGIEDLWGNCIQWVDGLVSDGNRNILTSNDSPNYNDAGTGYSSFSTGFSSNFNAFNTNIQGTSVLGFIGKGTDKGSSATYYCDIFSIVPNRVPRFGGGFINRNDAGCFYLDIYNKAPSESYDEAARLVYKPTE